MKLSYRIIIFPKIIFLDHKSWKSDVTYEGFTKFGLGYIEQLGLLEMDDRDLLFEDILNERRY